MLRPLASLLLEFSSLRRKLRSKAVGELYKLGVVRFRIGIELGIVNFGLRRELRVVSFGVHHDDEKCHYLKARFHVVWFECSLLWLRKNLSRLSATCVAR